MRTYRSNVSLMWFSPHNAKMFFYSHGHDLFNYNYTGGQEVLQTSRPLSYKFAASERHILALGVGMVMSASHLPVPCMGKVRTSMHCNTPMLCKRRVGGDQSVRRRLGRSRFQNSAKRSGFVFFQLVCKPPQMLPFKITLDCRRC